MIKTPVIMINLKVYESAIGERAVKLSKLCEKVAKQSGVEIVVCVDAPDIYRVSKAVSIPVFAQHFDAVDFGKNTGSVLAESVKENGAVGSLLNHAERQIDLDTIRRSVERARKVGLTTCVCANDVGKAKEIAKFNPDFIAVEIPELIGTGNSITSVNPDVVKAASVIYTGGKSNRILVGAGVTNGEDVRKSIEYKTFGVLLASGVTTARDPEKVLKDLVSGLKN